MGRRFKFLYCGAAYWTSGFKGSVLCCCNMQPAGPHISCDARFIKVKLNSVLFTWTFVIAYSGAKLKSNGDRASSCCRPF
jgi:hypothetical protein